MTSRHFVRKVGLLYLGAFASRYGSCLLPLRLLLSAGTRLFISRVLGTGSAPVSGTSRVHAVLSLFAHYVIKCSAFWQVPCLTSNDALAFMVSTVTFIEATTFGVMFCNKLYT